MWIHLMLIFFTSLQFNTPSVEMGRKFHRPSRRPFKGKILSYSKGLSEMSLILCLVRAIYLFPLCTLIPFYKPLYKKGGILEMRCGKGGIISFRVLSLVLE
jgi:hypothetical protein